MPRFAVNSIIGICRGVKLFLHHKTIAYTHCLYRVPKAEKDSKNIDAMQTRLGNDVNTSEKLAIFVQVWYNW